MTQVFSAETFSSTEDILPKNHTNFDNDFAFNPLEKPLTLPISQVDIEKELDDESSDGETIIRGVDSTNESQPFLKRRAERLAEVATVNVVALGYEYHKVFMAAKDSIEDGTLDLASEYPNMNPERQLERFVTTSLEKALQPRDEIMSQIKADREQYLSGIDAPLKELRDEIARQKEAIIEQSKRILEVRKDLEEGGASEEFMKKFLYTVKLMSPLEQEDYEQEMNLAVKNEVTPLVETEDILFKDIVSSEYPQDAIVRVLSPAPHSAEVTVIKQVEHVES